MRVLTLMLMLCVTTWLRAAEWVAFPGTHVTVLVQPGEQRLATSTLTAADDLAATLGPQLGVAHPGPFPVFVYASSIAFMQDTGRAPELRGISYSPSGRIRIDASRDPLTVRHTLAHELVHSLLDQRLGPAIGLLPTWVNEGIAGHLADPIPREQLPGVAHLVHRDGVLTLAQLDAAFATGERRDAAYQQSRAMVAWLEYEHPGSIAAIVSAIAHGESFPSALALASGLTPADWWERWQGGIPAFVYVLNLLTSPVVYAPLAILMVLLALRRLRKSDEEQEEEDEEDEEGPHPPPASPPPAGMLHGQSYMEDTEGDS